MQTKTLNQAARQAGWPGARPHPCHVVLEGHVSNGPITPAPARGARLRVLVADDDADTTSSLCRLVSCWGHDVRSANDGAEALRLAFAYQPDVLILDIAMPGMSGYDLARRLRDDPRFEDALLIAITGYADDGHRFLGAAAGFDQYLVKPVEPSVVETLLRLERDRLAGLLRIAPQAGFRIE